MKKHIRYTMVVLAGMLLLWGGSAMASETRIFSMGKTGRFTHDNSNLQLFPGSLYRYNNLIITEMRIKNDEDSFSAGIHLPLGLRALGAIYMNSTIDVPVPEIAGSGLSFSDATDVLVAFKVGENNLGLRVSFAFENNDQTTDSTISAISESASYFEFAGGVSNDRYDFGAYFGLPSLESKIGSATTTWEGLGFGVAGRFFLGPENGPMQYVPVVVINQFSTDLVRDLVDATSSFLDFSMGVGIHYQLDESNLVVLGTEIFGIRQNVLDAANVGKETVSVTNMPAFYLGGETRAKRWLLLRLGATHEIQETKTTFRLPSGEKTETSKRDSKFGVSVGVGIELGRFLLDLDINDNFLFEGPDFISGQGSDSVNDFVNRLSISYNF